MTGPRGWANAKLSEITPADAPIIYGILQPGPNLAEGVPYVRPTEIDCGEIDVATVRRTSPEIAHQYSRSKLQAGDLILSIVGTIGKVAATPASLDGGNITQSSCRIRPHSELVEAGFLKAFLRAPTAIAQYDRKRLGTAVPRLNIADIRDFDLPLPPPSEQRRIVAKLDTLTDRLSCARKELDRVTVLAYNLRAQTLSDERARLASENTASIAQIAEIAFDGPFGSNLKSADYTSEGVRVVRLENIGHLRFIDDRRTFISQAKYANLARHTLKPGDILFSSFVDRNVRVCQFPENAGIAINKADCFTVRPNRRLCDPRLVTYFLSSFETFEAMRARVHGATRPRIGLKDLREYTIPLPSLKDQTAIADRIDATFARADRLEAEAARARKLIDRLEAAILAKAFRGELVPQDPNDEPASIMLERIRAERAAAPKPKRGRRTKAG